MMFSFLNVVLCFSEIYWNEQKEQKITPTNLKKDVSPKKPEGV